MKTGKQRYREQFAEDMLKRHREADFCKIIFNEETGDVQLRLYKTWPSGRVEYIGGTSCTKVARIHEYIVDELNKDPMSFIREFSTKLGNKIEAMVNA